MELIDSLKFVKNGYARVDLVPELTYFVIRDGRITAYNGTTGISCPIDLSFNIAPHAGHFYKCIDACEESVSLTIEKERLRVKSGGFKAIVNCIPYERIPTLIPRGTSYTLPVEILPTLRKLLRFQEEDNQKEFANGILLDNASGFVTNGKVLIEAWIGTNLPTVNIPKKALTELCRNDEEPESILIDHDMIYFMLPAGKWIASKLIVHKWPDLSKFFDAPASPVAPVAGFWEALERLSKFADESGACHFQGAQMATRADTSTDGASVDCAGLPVSGIYNSKELLKLKGIANTFDFTSYPQPVQFMGDKLRGVLVGYRQ